MGRCRKVLQVRSTVDTWVFTVEIRVVVAVHRLYLVPS
jgi:hypothetical protein